MAGQITGAAGYAQNVGQAISPSKPPMESEISKQRKECAIVLEELESSLTILDRRLYSVRRQVGTGNDGAKLCESPVPSLSEIAAEFYGIENRVRNMLRRVNTVLDELALD